ncbi:HU-CCDC81 and SPOR domain-containing protein [Prevotella sp. PINT]|jgi:Sporulation related domain.|uniref:HU domain-containing protein n=1 Tax=Palleniella intestinalis TaxID=2736291 RepID=UPI0015526A5F|nr:SPOR domain-containing protein [Palleniella intestinalis]NPD80838.1 HU-CCDC81 and SPOR domain-containing protein [Palleniella intestinalis]
MIRLDKHIEILLLDNDCVIVPGLGGFMAHHVCARYDAETQSFLPPLRQLGFNSQLQINDSLLAQSYIEAYDISYPEALRRIEDEVTELQQKIRNEGKCELNDIGVLTLNENGKIEFEPCEAGILTPELYGLNTIDIAPLRTTATVGQSEETHVGIPHQEPKPAPQLAVAQDIARPAVEENELEESATERTISIRVSTLKHVGTIAATILALLVFSLPVGQTSKPTVSESYMDTGILYNILPKQMRNADSADKSVMQYEVKPVNKEEMIDTESIEQASAPAAETEIEQQFFSIVLASRVPEDNAHDFVKQLRKQGFDKAEMITRKNGAKVIYGRFSSEKEALDSLRNLRNQSEHFNDGWVMEF